MHAYQKHYIIKINNVSKRKACTKTQKDFEEKLVAIPKSYMNRQWLRIDNKNSWKKID